MGKLASCYLGLELTESAETNWRRKNRKKEKKQEGRAAAVNVSPNLFFLYFFPFSPVEACRGLSISNEDEQAVDGAGKTNNTNNDNSINEQKLCQILTVCFSEILKLSLVIFSDRYVRVRRVLRQKDKTKPNVRWVCLYLLFPAHVHIRIFPWPSMSQVRRSNHVSDADAAHVDELDTSGT